jgi:hypothetical protein
MVDPCTSLDATISQPLSTIATRDHQHLIARAHLRGHLGPQRLRIELLGLRLGLIGHNMILRVLSARQEFWDS